MKFFISYPWPGNVRQLKHVIESAISSIPPDRTEIRMHDMPHYLLNATTTYVWNSAGYLCTIFSSSCLTCCSGTGSCTGFSRSLAARITAGHLTTGEPSAGNTVHDHRREGKAEDTGCSPANWRQYFQSGAPAWYQSAKAFLPYEKTRDPPLMGSRVFYFCILCFFIVPANHLLFTLKTMRLSIIIAPPMYIPAPGISASINHPKTAVMNGDKKR